MNRGVFGLDLVKIESVGVDMEAYTVDSTVVVAHCQTQIFGVTSRVAYTPEAEVDRVELDFDSSSGIPMVLDTADLRYLLGHPKASRVSLAILAPH